MISTLLLVVLVVWFAIEAILYKEEPWEQSWYRDDEEDD